MLALLWLIPALPFLGFLILALVGPRLSRPATGAIGVSSVGLAGLVALLVGGAFISSPPPDGAYVQHLWTWMDVAGFTPEFAFYLDSLSLVMVLVVTGVGFLILLYSTEFMIDEAGYSRFFAYMSLFVGAMLVLLLADNLLLLYLGWEGVGLCSYLLIGFWYQDEANGRAARKAFIVTRIGDAAMALALFLIFANLGTLQIQELMVRAAQNWAVGSGLAVTAAGLLLVGSLGKSAQLPLQTWLPDAMAGPTPVSALIHAATMVTAGVYLIARTNLLFTLAPVVLTSVAVIGALTLLLAGFSALTQRDIKRVLAYSTISQIGYMFLALGVAAWSAAIFHFMTHAFFKALLFLGAGAVILVIHQEHDMFKMGGLRRQLPVTFWTFLLGAASLAALPLVTAGFYSKELILFEAWSSAWGSPWLWLAGLIGAFVTSIYTFRMVFLTFFGRAKGGAVRRPGLPIRLPLLILAVLSVAGGFVELPATLGGFSLFTGFMHWTLPAVPLEHAGSGLELLLQLVAAVVSLAGIYLAYLFYLQRPDYPKRLTDNAIGLSLFAFWYVGWGFDALYDTLFVRPYLRLARANRDDLVDLIPVGVAWLSRSGHYLLSRAQSGLVRSYALGIAIGAVLLVAIALFV